MRNNIESLRKQRHMSVQDLADAVGISRQYLYDLKIGNKQLNQNLLHRFAQVFNIHPADIIDDRGFSETPSDGFRNAPSNSAKTPRSNETFSIPPALLVQASVHASSLAKAGKISESLIESVAMESAEMAAKMGWEDVTELLVIAVADARKV
jgi:transcriptional regulator with XRE-family HTH domain